MKAGGSGGEGRGKRIVGTQCDTEQAVKTQCPRNKNKRESFVPFCQIKKKKIAWWYEDKIFHQILLCSYYNIRIGEMLLEPGLLRNIPSSLAYFPLAMTIIFAPLF